MDMYWKKNWFDLLVVFVGVWIVLTKTIGNTISITTSKPKPSIITRACGHVENPKHPFVFSFSWPAGANAFPDNLGTVGLDDVWSGEDVHRRVWFNSNDEDN